MAESALSPLFSLWNKVQEKSSSVESPSPQFVMPKLTKLNDMVYLVYQPPPEVKPELEVVFFHGLQLQHCKEPYAATWMTRDNSECWLQTWLVESFPKSRIFTVSYDSSATKTQDSGRMDMYQTGENLVSDLTGDDVGLGQAGCPVVLVGHCLGGLVLKEMCLFAENASRRKTGKPRAQRAHAFFSNLKGMFFYGTPHTGSMLGDMLQDCFKGVGALSEEIETLKASSTRRNESFMELKSENEWLTFGIGESRETYVGCIGKYIHVGPEASTRPYMDEYYSAPGDHYEICKPKEKNDSAFLRLCEFLSKVQEYGSVQRGAMVEVNAQLQYYVDKEGRADQVQRMLAQSDTDTIFIVGLSGSGKTALAQQVFYKIRHDYDVACFVSLDSIEATASPRQYTLMKIREELGEVDRGSRHPPSIIHRFIGRKVLMVLDNVESQDQLDALCVSAWLQKSSSKIIVTTTNPSSIATTTPWLRSPLNTFNVPFLSVDESIELFSHYAFGDRDGPEDLKDYIHQVILKCDYYPLFLKILGACISKREFHDKQLWLDLVTRLEVAEEVNAGHDEKLWAKLRLCYDGLQASEKQIFLDIATNFHGFSLSLLKCIWKECRRTPHLALQNLQEQFLVYEDSGNIKMHQHLRNLGKVIACPAGIGIEKWQRISDTSTATKLINSHEGIVKTSVLTLHPMENEFLTLRRNTFQNYVHLECLILEDVSTQGIGLELPRSLVYLRWKNGMFVDCPVDFSRVENLAVIEFLDCKSLRSLPHDVVKARKLTWLELEGCELLTELPFGLSNCLDHLGLNRTRLQRLPKDLGKFKRLKSLRLNYTQLKRVPQQLCRLEMLANLDLSDTHLTSLPESFSDLKSLKSLNLVKTNLSSLPESIGQLQNLVSLDLDGTALDNLPDSICRLHSLRRLSLLKTELTTLPSDIGNLVGLTGFAVSSAKWRGFPESFGKLSNLLELAVALNPSGLSRDSEEDGEHGEESSLDPGDHGEHGEHGEESSLDPEDHLFPSQLTAFQTIASLYLIGRGCAQSSLPPLFSALQRMPLLEELFLVEFDLPEMIPSDLGKLTSLERLRINGWERLQEVPECLGKLCKLWFLELSLLPQLRRFPESSSAWPSSLKTLYIFGYGKLEHISQSVDQVSSLEGGCSTSNGNTPTPSESLNLALPSGLQVYVFATDSWSAVEWFSDSCGKHHSGVIEYVVKPEDWEQARKMAIDRGPEAESVRYVLDTTLASELFPEMRHRPCRRDIGLPEACHSFGPQVLCLITFQNLLRTPMDLIQVLDLRRKEDCEETGEDSVQESRFSESLSGFLWRVLHYARQGRSEFTATIIAFSILFLIVAPVAFLCWLSIKIRRGGQTPSNQSGPQIEDKASSPKQGRRQN